VIGEYLYRRVHFIAGNIYRFITACKYQKTILPDEACSIFGASFGRDGWHHIIETLKEYDHDTEINYRDTTLYAFLKHFTPEKISDFFVGVNTQDCNLSIFNWPWGTFKKNELFSEKQTQMSRFCGPSSDNFIKNEYDRTIALYKKIKKTGYKPWQYGNTFIGGTFLVKNSGLRRFVVLQGNHRIAILFHLGYAELDVREVKGYLVEVEEKYLKSWLLVKRGKCSVSQAKMIFNMFFEQNGHHLKQLLSNKGKLK
jgi:hypothetical protein